MNPSLCVYQVTRNFAFTSFICVILLFFLGLGLGGPADESSGHGGRVGEGAGPVVVPGTHILLRRHHAADAGGGSPLQDRRQQLQRSHAADSQTPWGELIVAETDIWGNN